MTAPDSSPQSGDATETAALQDASPSLDALRDQLVAGCTEGFARVTVYRLAQRFGWEMVSDHRFSGQSGRRFEGVVWAVDWFPTQ